MTISLRKDPKIYERNKRSNSGMPLTNDEDQASSIEMREVKDGHQQDDIKPSLRSLFAFTTRKHGVGLIWCIILSILSGLLKPISSIFYGNIFNALTNYGAGTSNSHDTLHDVAIWCIAVTALGGATWLLEQLFLSSWMVFGEVQAKSVREALFKGMLDKDLEWYDLRKDGVGSLLIRIETQVRELQLSVSQPLGFLVFQTVSSVACLGTALFFSWKLTLVIVATFPVTGGLLWLLSRKLGPAIEAQKRELTQASKLANTAITAIDTVKAFNGEDQEAWQYLSAIKRSTIHYMVQARCNALQFGITKFVIVAIFVQGFWYGISLVENGLDAGHVLTTFYACLMGMQNLEIILPQWLVLAKGMSAGATLKSIMDQVNSGSSVCKIEGSIKPNSCSGDIEVNDVTFAYPSNRQQNALIKSTFFFPAGETTYVVGKSGSGKSTLGNLLLKFYDPDEGQILIDGHPIQDLDTDWVRQNITLVLQQSVVFNESIRKNIEFGKEGASDEEDIMNACEEASLDEVITTLPLGLETVVGSKERQLSGGQKQRVALARAILRDAPILILDEGTSALDLACGLKVMANIRKWRKGKTTIIITHDISQILDDDYVYVMENSQVVQEGYRKKLSAKANGTFATFSPIPEEAEPESPISPGSPGWSKLPNPRRKSEPMTPSSATFGDVLSSRFSNASTLFDSSLLTTPRDHRTIDFSNNRLSFGYASAFANDLRAENIWATPNPNESLRGRFQDFQGPPPKPRRHSMRPPDYRYSSYLTPPPMYREQKSLPVSNISNEIYEESEGDEIEQIPKRRRPTSIRTDLPLPALAIDDPDVEKAEDSSRYNTSSKDGKGRIKPASLTHILSTVWPVLNKKDRIILLIGFFAAFINAAATPAFSIIFARLLDVFYLSTDQSGDAKKWSLALLGVAIVDGTACFISHYALEHCGQAWVNALRVEALKRILSQPKSWFEDSRNSPGRLNEVLDRNAEEMRNIVGRFAGLTFTAFWMLFISIVWAFASTWKLTLVTIGCGPFIFGLARIFTAVSSKWEHKYNYASEVSSSTFAETFSNIKIVRAFTLEGYFTEKHNKATDDAYIVGAKRANYAGLFFGLTNGITLFTTATIFYYAGVQVTQNQITVSIALQTVNLLLFGISNSTHMLNMVPQISSSRTTATHMLQLAKMPISSHETIGSKRLSNLFPIKLQHLNFTYPARPETRTLSDITLDLKPNTTIALVGASGSGKSTITSLLIGLYPPDSATFPSLTYNSVPIQECHTPSLRALISIVPQQPMLFPTSIYLNIVYGLSETSSFYTLSSAISAAKSAGIHEFIISLPSGYNTLVGEGGQALSGGQAQRVAISRALVRKPRLLILDEATSGLDGGSAEVVREAVKRLKNVGGMCTLVVSHTKEMMKMAEKVVVLDLGRIIEEGGYEELRGRRGGAFRELIGEGEEAEKVVRGTGDMRIRVDLGNGEGSSVGAERMRGWEGNGGMNTPIRDGRRRDTWVRNPSL